MHVLLHSRPRSAHLMRGNRGKCTGRRRLGAPATTALHGDPEKVNSTEQPTAIIRDYPSWNHLTVRHDRCAYVSVSSDGLDYTPLKPWSFDDGGELGSYNTQQHWVTHSDGLFLVYTRRGADNDHIMRHRAPLFMGQVDTGKLCVIRSTERILVPERGATLGNFGAATVSPEESWVTVSEGIWGEDARKRGAEGCTFVARVIWDNPRGSSTK